MYLYVIPQLWNPFLSSTQSWITPTLFNEQRLAANKSKQCNFIHLEYKKGIGYFKSIDSLTPYCSGGSIKAQLAMRPRKAIAKWSYQM